MAYAFSEPMPSSCKPLLNTSLDKKQDISSVRVDLALESTLAIFLNWRRERIGSPNLLVALRMMGFARAKIGAVRLVRW